MKLWKFPTKQRKKERMRKWERKFKKIHQSAQKIQCMTIRSVGKRKTMYGVRKSNQDIMQETFLELKYMLEIIQSNDQKDP